MKYTLIKQGLLINLMGSIVERKESKTISKFWTWENYWMAVPLTEMRRLKKEQIWSRKLRVLFLMDKKKVKGVSSQDGDIGKHGSPP